MDGQASNNTWCPMTRNADDRKWFPINCIRYRPINYGITVIWGTIEIYQPGTFMFLCCCWLKGVFMVFWWLGFSWFSDGFPYICFVSCSLFSTQSSSASQSQRFFIVFLPWPGQPWTPWAEIYFQYSDRPQLPYVNMTFFVLGIAWNASNRPWTLFRPPISV